MKAAESEAARAWGAAEAAGLLTTRVVDGTTSLWSTAVCFPTVFIAGCLGWLPGWRAECFEGMKLHKQTTTCYEVLPESEKFTLHWYMHENFISYWIVGIFATLIIVFSIIFSFFKYPSNANPKTVSSIAQSGVHLGLFGICTANTIECDESLICDVYNSNTGQGICKKALGSQCEDIFECVNSAQICVQNPTAKFKTCEVSTVGGIGQYPGTNGCDTGLEKDPVTGLCLQSLGQVCALDSSCISGNCFNSICSAKLGEGQKCLRDANCITNFGCNTNYQNNGVINDSHRICINSTTKDSIVPRKFCISNNDCASGEECSPPYGVCQNNAISSRAKHAACNSNYKETCVEHLGCATLTTSGNGRCEPLIPRWPTTVNCTYDPSLDTGSGSSVLDGSSCPRPMRCSTQFVSPSADGCLFLPNFACSEIDGCIYGNCNAPSTGSDGGTEPVMGTCVSTAITEYRNWRWNPISNGTVPTWASDNITGSVSTPPGLFDGASTFPALTVSSNISTVVYQGTNYTFFQPQVLTFNTTGADPEIYQQVGKNVFVKMVFNIIDQTFQPDFEAQVLCIFPYFSEQADPGVGGSQNPHLGLAVNIRRSGGGVLEGVVFMATTLNPTGTYDLLFQTNSFTYIQAGYPTWLSRVKIFKNYIEFVNDDPAVSGKAYFGDQAQSAVVNHTLNPGAISPYYPLIIISPNFVTPVASTISVIDIQRYRASSSPIGDIVCYLRSDFMLLMVPSVSNPTTEVSVSANVDTFSIDQTTSAVFYVFKPDASNSVPAISAQYQLSAHLDNNYYIPFPVGNDGTTGVVTDVKHLIAHNYYNSATNGYTGDLILHTNTMTIS